MKKRKLMSMLLACALTVTMATPVLAADGGSIDVNVTTKTGILRVEVPTTLAIAVDQFEISNVGTQIYSEPFDIVNKSQIDVKVGVTSTATVGSGVELAEKRADIATATAAGGTAWLAVVAKKSADNYEAASGDDDFAKLNEASTNVTTFAKADANATAEQTFYLKQGQDGSATYHVLEPAEAKDNQGISYAQFFEMTKITLTSTNDAGLQKEVDKSDVYAVDKVTSGAAVAVKFEKKEESVTYDSNKDYYTIANAATEVKDLAAGKKYVYGEMTEAATGAKAGFRYIGALSTNKETWNSTDISKVNITYTIQGLSKTAYSAAEGEIVYGLYKEPASATPSVSAESVAAGGSVTITLPTGVTIKEIQKMKTDGTFNTLSTEHYKLEDVSEGQKLTVKSSLKEAFPAAKSIKIVFSTGEPITITIK